MELKDDKQAPPVTEKEEEEERGGERKRKEGVRVPGWAGPALAQERKEGLGPKRKREKEEERGNFEPVGEERANVRSHTCDWQSNHPTRRSNFFVVEFFFVARTIASATKKYFSNKKICSRNKTRVGLFVGLILGSK